MIENMRLGMTKNLHTDGVTNGTPTSGLARHGEPPAGRAESAYKSNELNEAAANRNNILSTAAVVPPPPPMLRGGPARRQSALAPGAAALLHDHVHLPVQPSIDGVGPVDSSSTTLVHAPAPPATSRSPRTNPSAGPSPSPQHSTPSIMGPSPPFTTSSSRIVSAGMPLYDSRTRRHSALAAPAGQPHPHHAPPHAHPTLISTHGSSSLHGANSNTLLPYSHLLSNPSNFAGLHLSSSNSPMRLARSSGDPTSTAPTHIPAYPPARPGSSVPGLQVSTSGKSLLALGTATAPNTALPGRPAAASSTGLASFLAATGTHSAYPTSPPSVSMSIAHTRWTRGTPSYNHPNGPGLGLGPGHGRFLGSAHGGSVSGPDGLTPVPSGSGQLVAPRSRTATVTAAAGAGAFSGLITPAGFEPGEDAASEGEGGGAEGGGGGGGGGARGGGGGGGSVVVAGRKATSFSVLRCQGVPGRAFHLAWAAVFLAFAATFAPAALLPAIARDLELSKGAVDAAAVLSLVASIPTRLAMGWLLRRYGPRYCQVSMLLATALLSSCMALVRNAVGFAILRFLLGSSLGSFVIAQFWIIDCFDPSVLGAVAAICAGWGNAGSGAAMLVMPFLYEMLYDGSGVVASSVEAWRTAFFFLSAALVLVAVLTLLFGQDTPRGDLIDLQKRKAASELWAAAQHGSETGVNGSGNMGGGGGGGKGKQQRDRDRERAKRKAGRQQAQLQQVQQQQRARALREAAASGDRMTEQTASEAAASEQQGMKQKQALGLVERAGSLLQRKKDRDGGRDRAREGEEQWCVGGLGGSAPVTVSSFTAAGAGGIKAGAAVTSGGGGAAASEPLYGRSTTQDGAPAPVGGGRVVRGSGGSGHSSAPSFRVLRGPTGPLVVLGGPAVAVGEGLEDEQGEGEGSEGGEQGGGGRRGAGEASRDPRALDVAVAALLAHKSAATRHTSPPHRITAAAAASDHLPHPTSADRGLPSLADGRALHAPASVAQPASPHQPANPHQAQDVPLLPPPPPPVPSAPVPLHDHDPQAATNPHLQPQVTKPTANHHQPGPTADTVLHSQQGASHPTATATGHMANTGASTSATVAPAVDISALSAGAHRRRSTSARTSVGTGPSRPLPLVTGNYPTTVTSDASDGEAPDSRVNLTTSRNPHIQDPNSGPFRHQRTSHLRLSTSQPATSVPQAPYVYRPSSDLLTANVLGLPGAVRLYGTALRNHRTWLLAVNYGFCFGVQLVVLNVVTLFVTEQYGASVMAAGALGAIVGLPNFVTRPAGGLVSGLVCRRYGMRGRVWLLWACQTAGGLLCVSLGLAAGVHIALEAVLLLLFAVCCHMACGATMGVAPYVSYRAYPAVLGAVTAGGQAVGAVLQGAFFSSTEVPYREGLLWLGVAACAGGLSLLLLDFPMWGSMLRGPRAGQQAVQEEHYYLAEWTGEEVSLGLAAPALAFAEMARGERGSWNFSEEAKPLYQV